MKQISGKDIYQAFTNGAVKINHNISNLNEINFFPVPDGDTGENMANTINTIVDHVEDQTSVKSVVSGMSKGALVGARGNSGFIFAQFINGFYQQNKNKDKITEKEFVKSLRKAVPYVFEAISNPVHGTIITLIDQWTSFLNEHYEKEKNFNESLEMSLDHSKNVLELTKVELEVLKKNHVVDAGAKGFYHFIEGIVEYFISGTVYLRDKIERKLLTDSHELFLDHDSNYRYCTEIFFKGQEFDKKEIRQTIDKIGDSGIIVLNDKEGKVHVHTNNPEKLAKKIFDLGYQIIENKVDDMKFQVDDREESNKRIALVTDSVADISPELIEKYHIYMIPLTLTMNNSEFLDRVTIQPKEFFDYVDKSNQLPKSSMPNLKLVKRLFDHLLNEYDDIVYVSLAGALSGTFNAITKLANQLSSHIHTIDSRKNSGAQGLVTLEVAKYIEENKSIDYILSKVSSIIERTDIYVAVDNFDYMVMGGRVPKTIGSFGRLLNLKPIVSLDENGKGTAFGASFSKKSVIKKIMKILKKKHEDQEIEKAVITYSNDFNQAKKLANKIEEDFKIPVEYIQEISNVVAISAGKNAISVSFLLKEV